MGRARRVVLVLVIAAAAAAVVTLATGALNSSHNGRRGSAGSPGRSPACLPATLSASAKLPGVALDVSPAPQTDTANPHTQISFLGAAADHIAGVSVTGERSGAHPGRLAPYSQGDGASFLPDAPFDPGERVTVAATVIGGGSAGAGTPLRFSFRVDTP
ncbi:MAG: hypothetical protein KGJ43_09380, partial [Acidobacteriota bacterium]|nr:hypothetical protein [Acidobacteriota bacterium]